MNYNGCLTEFLKGFHTKKNTVHIVTIVPIVIIIIITVPTVPKHIAKYKKVKNKQMKTEQQSINYQHENVFVIRINKSLIFWDIFFINSYLLY